MLPRASIACLVGLALVGCYSASTPTRDGAAPDGGVTLIDAAQFDAGAPIGDGNPGVCSEAPPLALDALVEIGDVSVAAVPAADTCWDSATDAYLFYRLEIPARTGIEVRTRGVDAPVAGLVDRCVPEPGDRCHYYGPSGFFEPGEPERSSYFGNVDASARTLFLELWWVGESPTPFSIETRSFPIAEHASCEDARALAPDALVPASTERGGTYESWECGYLPESHFYEIVVPARSVAMPLDGSQSLNARSACECAPFVNEPLVNLESVPRAVLVEAIPDQPIGVQYAPLPPNALCESPELIMPGSEHVLAPYPRLVSGVEPCVTNDAHFYEVEVPAHARVELTYRLVTAYPNVTLLESCDGECVTPDVIGLPDGGRAIVLANETDVAVRRLIAVGSEGPAEGPLEGSLIARLVD